VRRRGTNDETPEEALDAAAHPAWLQRAREEIELRLDLGAGGRRDFLDHMLQMEARLKSQYPSMPFQVKNEFNARLSARGYSEEAWDEAVAWLESTDWFRLSWRRAGRPGADGNHLQG
jgi:SOS response regulatory protein OraA/RecX